MRDRPGEFMERGRIRQGEYGSDPSYRCCGAFHVMCPETTNVLIVLADDGRDGVIKGWEHVSVSRRRHPPNWTEMAWVKRQFWNDEECVVEFHPPKSQYVNCHPNCLHLWRPIDIEIPRPPTILVGPQA